MVQRKPQAAVKGHLIRVICHRDDFGFRVRGVEVRASGLVVGCEPCFVPRSPEIETLFPLGSEAVEFAGVPYSSETTPPP